MDIGTQTIAAVGEQKAFLNVFCQELQRDERRRRRLQRMLDRSQRAMNPEHYNANGTIKDRNKRPLTWNESRAYKNLRKRLAETSRKEADYRKNLHGQMVARVLHLGSDIRTEKLSLSGFQRRRRKADGNTRKGYGKSLGFRAPGLFLKLLRKEAEKWG